jgi:hypothetical protein
MYANKFGIKSQTVDLYKVTRTLDNGKIQVLGYEGGKSCRSGQYHWYKIESNIYCRFTFEEATVQIKDFNTYRRYVDGSVRKPFHGLFQIVPI